MRPTAISKLPDLRKVRLLLIRALDAIPADGPDWHPTYQAAKRVRGHVKEAKRAAEEYLGPGE